MALGNKETSTQWAEFIQAGDVGTLFPPKNVIGLRKIFVVECKTATIYTVYLILFTIFCNVCVCAKKNSTAIFSPQNKWLLKSLPATKDDMLPLHNCNRLNPWEEPGWRLASVHWKELVWPIKIYYREPELFCGQKGPIACILTHIFC